MSYLTGPLAVAIWYPRHRRLAWTAVTVATLVASLVLVLGVPSLGAWLARQPGGVLLWLALVPTMVVAIATAWSVSIDHAGRADASRGPLGPGWLRHPSLVLLLGAALPGLGLLVAGHPRRAAMGLWIVGPLAAAAIVLARWRWLWERSRLLETPGVGGTTLEVAFVVAAGIGAIAVGLWIVQALDGMRRVSTGRSVTVSNAITVMLLLSLAYGAASFRPAAIAHEVHAASVVLRIEGLRLIPLMMCDAASRLDPVEPAYLADAAGLNESLGMQTAARTKRELIERRMQSYLDLAFADDSLAEPAPLSDRVRAPLDVEDHLPIGNARTRRATVGVE